MTVSLPRTAVKVTGDSLHKESFLQVQNHTYLDKGRSNEQMPICS